MNLYEHRVRYYETDKMGIVHHSNYIRWMEEARIDFFEQLGWNFRKIEDTGIVSPVVSVDCKYKNSTFFDDVIKICVKVEEFKGVKLKLSYEMKRDDLVVCEAQSEHCFLNSEGHILNLKREIPGLYKVINDMIGEDK